MQGSLDDVTPYSREQLVAAILGAIFGTGFLLLCIVYFLRRRPNSRYTPVRGDQDTASAEFNLRRRRDSQPEVEQLNLGPITSQSQYASLPTRDTAVSSALYPTGSSAASSGRARGYPRIIVTSPTIPSASSFSTESHHNGHRTMYDSNHASLNHEDTTYTGLPPRPSSPIPNRHARSGYLPVGGNDEEEVDMMYDPAAHSDAPNTNNKWRLIKKMKYGTLPPVPTSSPGTSRLLHARTESRTPLLQTDVPQSSRPRPEQLPQPQPQPESRPHIQLNLQPPPEPPRTKPLAPLITPPAFPPPSHPPPRLPTLENIREVAFDNPYSVSRNNNQPSGAPQDKTHSSAQGPPIPIGSTHFSFSPPTRTEMGTSISLKSQPPDTSMDQPATNPSTIPTFPSTSYQVVPRAITKTTEMSDRSQTMYSMVESFGSPSHQYSMDSPLPSSKALSHSAYADKKDPSVDSNSPAKSLSPTSITPSTGGPTPSSWEFPLPPGALPLQHTKSDPSPDTSEAKPPRPRTKSHLSNIVATAADIKANNNGVVIPTISAPTARPMAEGSRSDSPNGAISKGNKSGLMTTESQVKIRKPITPDFFDNPEAEQKKSQPGADMHGEGVGKDVNVLSGIPMILAGSLNVGSDSTEGQTDQSSERAENSTQPGREGDVDYRESLTSYISLVTDDDNGTLERAEIKTYEVAEVAEVAVVAVRSPPTNVPELARWDTIHQMSGSDERARARSRSGSNATATESTRKRKSPDDSLPPMPLLPVDVKERKGDSSDFSSRATSTVEGQLVVIPMSLANHANRLSPLVPWTPSPAGTPLRLDTVMHPASPHHTTFNSSGRPPWPPLRLQFPLKEEQNPPSIPPSVLPIPDTAPISFGDFVMVRPPNQETDESPAPAKEENIQAEPAVVTVHEASPRVVSEVSEVGWQPGHASDSSMHSQGTADTFGLSATNSISMRGVQRRGPRPIPHHDREPSGSGTSIASISHQNTGSHGTSGRSHGASGSGSQNDGYVPAVDYIFGPPPPVIEQPEPDTESESHYSQLTAPVSRNLSQKAVAMTAISPPPSVSPLPLTNTDTPFSGRTSVSSMMSGLSRPRAGSTRPNVGVVRGPRDRSSSVRAVLLPSSSSSSRGHSMNPPRPLSSSLVPAPQAESSSLSPDNAAGSSKPKRDSTLSNNSLLDLYSQSPSRSTPGSPPPLSNGHPQSHPS